MIEAYDPFIAQLERYIVKTAKHHDPLAYAKNKKAFDQNKFLGL